jgi:hypothetical protein
MFTLITRAMGEIGLQAVHGLCKQSSYRGFSSAAWAGEQICMRHTTCQHRVAQGLHNMILANNLIPALRAPFPI